MRKLMILFVALIASFAITTQMTYGQTGVHITVYPQLVAGTLSGGTTPLCYGGTVGLISGTLPTGGQGTYSYQWEKSTDGGLTWNNILGAISQNYNPGIVYVSTDYRRKDTDLCGTVHTNTISIMVYGQFLAGTTTGGTTPICNGDNGGTLTSTTETGGAPGTTYQWEISINGGGTWNDIVGETSLIHVVGALTQTSSFRLRFDNPACDTLYGNVISIMVYNTFVAGTVTGGNSPICYNSNAGILTSTAPTGGTPGTTLQWEASTDGITYSNIVGATTLTLNLGTLTQTMWYRLRYNNTCSVLYSNVMNIVVYGQFTAGTATFVGTSPACYNTDPGIINGTPATGGDPITNYQWQSSTNGGNTWTIIPGATLINYDIPALTTSTQFRRQDMNLNCGTLYTNTISITVYPVFNPGIIGVDQAICYGATPLQLSFLTPPSGGNGVFTYQWESSTDGGILDPWAVIPGATTNTYQPPSLTAGIWYHVIVTNLCGIAPALP